MREKILIVEDEKDIVKMLEYNLKKEGFKVLAASDGESGLVFANRDLTDLVILDLMLPGMDGLEVCKALKKENKTASIPIIMLTARGQQEDKDWGAKVGVDCYMTKTFEAKDLLDKIKELLKE